MVLSHDKKVLLDAFSQEQEKRYLKSMEKWNKKINYLSKELTKEVNSYKKKEFLKMKTEILKTEIVAYKDERKKKYILEIARKHYKQFLLQTNEEDFKKFHKNYRNELLNEPRKTVGFARFVGEYEAKRSQEQKWKKTNHLTMMDAFRTERKKYEQTISLNFERDLERYQLIMENCIISADFESAEYYRHAYQEVFNRHSAFEKAKEKAYKRALRNFRFFLETNECSEKVIYGDAYFEQLVVSFEGMLTFNEFKEEQQYVEGVKRLQTWQILIDEAERLYGMNVFLRHVEMRKMFSKAFGRRKSNAM